MSPLLTSTFGSRLCHGAAPDARQRAAPSTSGRFWSNACPRDIDFKPLFKSNGCVFCHGEEGDGVAPGRPDFTAPEWQDGRTDEQLTQIISDGKDTRMPKFGATLAAAGIRAAVKYVRRFRQH